MIYELSVVERLQLLDILPQDGDVVTLRIIRDLQRELSFTEQEIAESNIKTTGNQVSWNPASVATKPIDLGPKALSIIVETLSRLSAEKRLHMAKLPLYERFVEGERHGPANVRGIDSQRA